MEFLLQMVNMQHFWIQNLIQNLDIVRTLGIEMLNYHIKGLKMLQFTLLLRVNF